MITSSKHPGTNSKPLTDLVARELDRLVGKRYGELSVLVRDCHRVFTESIEPVRRFEIYVECRRETEWCGIEIEESRFSENGIITEVASCIDALAQHLALKHCDHEFHGPPACAVCKKCDIDEEQFKDYELRRPPRP